MIEIKFLAPLLNVKINKWLRLLIFLVWKKIKEEPSSKSSLNFNPVLIKEVLIY